MAAKKRERKTAWIGLDVHRLSITIVVLLGNSTVPKLTQRIPNNVKQLLRILESAAARHELKICYEAGSCGFSLYRALIKAGHSCMICAPGLIPTDTRRVKTDRKDAEKLAQYLRAGLLTAITIPDEALERTRDLIRFRASQVRQMTRAKQAVMSFLMRKGGTYKAKKTWSTAFMDRLYAQPLPFEERVMLDRYLAHYTYHRKLVDELDAAVEETADKRFSAEATVLRAFRGVNTLTAMTLLTHVPDFRAFPSPRKLAAFAGLVPSEMSSGDNVKKGSITKTGSPMLRKALIAAAQQYGELPAGSGSMIRLRRAQSHAAVAAIAERADRRLKRRYRALVRAGKHTNNAKTAVARELIGFIWEAMMLFHGGELRNGLILGGVTRTGRI